MKTFFIITLLSINLFQIYCISTIYRNYQIMTWVANTLALDWKAERNLYLHCKVGK